MGNILVNIFKNLFSITEYNSHIIVKILFLKIKFKFSCLPIKRDKIVFSNYFGRPYGCNPKYITEEIIKQKLPYELVWLVCNANDDDIIEQFPAEVRLVEFDSTQAVKELCTAKLWIDNTRKHLYYLKNLPKKKNQRYIQTWHGSLGIKKIEAAIKDNDKTLWGQNAIIDSKYIDYILSDSEYDNYMFRNDFWYSGEIVKTGHPRCDIFFKSAHENLEIKTKVYNALGISLHKKVLLYVPTFRDDNDYDCLNLDVLTLKTKLEEKFGGEWVILVRLHPAIPNYLQDRFAYEGVVNASVYPDNLELLAISDCVITDYSSCIFDFLFTKRPAFIYAPDLDKYNTTRGFYFPLESAPFDIACDNNQLFDNILKFDMDYYNSKLKVFLDKNNCLEDGKSSYRTVELVKQIMNGEK